MITHGKDGRVYANGYDLSAYLRSASVTREGDTAEVTTFSNNGAKSYIAGLANGMLTAAGLFDPAANVGSNDILRNALGGDASGNADNVWIVWPQGDTRGNAGLAMLATGTKYAVNTPVNDVVDVQAEATSSVGVDNVTSLLALSSKTGTGAETSVDNAASSANGGAAYVLATTGTAFTSATVKVQHSSDNVTFADLCSFSITAENTAARATFTGTVNRYVRANITAFSGTNLTLNVAVARS